MDNLGIVFLKILVVQQDKIHIRKMQETVFKISKRRTWTKEIYCIVK